MASLHDVLIYFCREYPQKEELSKARLTKMVYLADWRSAILYRRQLTDLVWQFNHYGPYVEDVVAEARASQDFEVVRTENMYGSKKDVVRETGRAGSPTLSDAERGILDHVISETASLYWGEFIKLVYSTYPIVHQLRYEELDLVKLAEEYAKLTPTLSGDNSD